MDIQMNERFNAAMPVKLASKAALSLAVCTASATAYDTPEYKIPQKPAYNIPALDSDSTSNSSNVVKLQTVSASGLNSFDLKLHTNNQLDDIAKSFITDLRDHQVDLDLETKSIIAENLWNLYD